MWLRQQLWFDASTLCRVEGHGVEACFGALQIREYCIGLRRDFWSFPCGKDDVKKVKQQVRMIQVLRTEANLVRC